MATLTLALPSSLTKKPPANRFYIKTADNKYHYGVPIAPVEVTYSNFGNTWSEVARDGRSPLLVKEASNLKKIAFTLQLFHSDDPDHNFENALRAMRAMSESTVPVRITYGGYFDNFSWRITSYQFKSVRRHPVTSAVTQAEVDLELTQVSDVVLSTGPASGGVKKPSSSSKSKSSKSTKKSSSSKSRTYTVKKGDTLSSISIHLYHNASKWRQLADKNHIKNPNKIYPGQKLKY